MEELHIVSHSSMLSLHAHRHRALSVDVRITREEVNIPSLNSSFPIVSDVRVCVSVCGVTGDLLVG